MTHDGQKPIWCVRPPEEPDSKKARPQEIYIASTSWFDVRGAGHRFFGVPEVDTFLYEDSMKVLLESTKAAVYRLDITGDGFKGTLRKDMVLLKKAVRPREPLIVQVPTALMLTTTQVRAEKKNAEKVRRSRRRTL